MATPPMMAPQPAILPQPGGNQVDAVGQRSGKEIAKWIFENHRRGLEARREGLLIGEKLLMHADGTGDKQWADIYRGQRIVIPRAVSEFRKTENVLGLLVANAIAHHTTMPLQFFAEAGTDRRAMTMAMMDTLWANHLAYVQDLNALFADALTLAMCAGFCPVHAYWRSDVTNDWYEPVGYEAEQAGAQAMAPDPAPGMIDCFVGNPWDTVFDFSSKRGSVLGCQYGRILPADLVRATFPEAAGLEGTDEMPSAAEFQRIAKSWNMVDLGVHGDPTMMTRRGGGEELMAVICREEAPTRADPGGRLRCIVIPGKVDALRGQGTGSNAVLVADQALPAGSYSWTNFYSDHRGSDVYGKPWLEDKDQLQVDLNIALSKRWEVMNRMIEAPIVAPGGAIAEDMMDLDGYKLLEIEPSLAAWRPKVMEWPQGILQGLDKEIAEKRQALYTAGGYQAVSRGESPGSRTPYRAILALQQADNTVHGPVNQRFQRSACEFMRGPCWRNMKMYGDVAWFIPIAGDQFAYLAEPYIDNTKLSEEPPQYKLVNAFGASPELRAQEILELVQIRGQDGQPFLRTDEARRAYPNHLVFDEGGDPQAVQRRRARTVASAFHDEARKYRQTTQLTEMDPQHPWVQKAAWDVFQAMEKKYLRLRDDDLMAHLAAYTESIQDETADPIARQALVMRQELYFQWQAAMAGQMPYRPTNRPTPPGGGGGGGPETNTISKRSVGAEMEGGGQSLQGAAQ